MRTCTSLAGNHCLCRIARLSKSSSTADSAEDLSTISTADSLRPAQFTSWGLFLLATYVTSYRQTRFSTGVACQWPKSCLTEVNGFQHHGQDNKSQLRALSCKFV